MAGGDGTGRVSRRTVLGGVVVGAAALLPSAVRGFGGAAATPPGIDAAASRLSGLLSDPSSARRLGQAYLETTARWPALEEVVRSLLPLGTSVEGAARVDEVTLRDRVAALHRADLRDGRHFLFEQWFHSETVGRLAALTILR